MKPPMVVDVIIPSSHKMISTTAMVHNIMHSSSMFLLMAAKTGRLCLSPVPAPPACVSHLHAPTEISAVGSAANLSMALDSFGHIMPSVLDIADDFTGSCRDVLVDLSHLLDAGLCVRLGCKYGFDY